MVAQATLIPTTATTEGTKGTKRFKCPVHHGKNLSVAVGFINGRAWAKCWSHGCSQRGHPGRTRTSANTPVTPLGLRHLHLLHALPPASNRCLL